MALKIEAFKKLNTESELNFVHYWTNDGENFPDVTNIEDYLETYTADNVYGWVEMPDLRFSHEYLDRLTIEVAGTELEDNKVIFLRISDDSAPNELTQYFYCTDFSYVSDQSYDVNAYRAECEMDYWATFGCKMHAIMKTTDEPILFKNKMMDRFVRVGVTTANPNGTGYIIDFLNQPWLQRITPDDATLIRDEDEPNLSLTEWMYINSDEIDSTKLAGWASSIWYPWYNDQFLSIIAIGNDSTTTTTADNIATYFQNNSVGELSQWSIDLNDSNYNSNGKYKWLVTRTGNNTVHEQTDAEGKNILTYGAMFRYGGKNDLKFEPQRLLYSESPVTFTPTITAGTMGGSSSYIRALTWTSDTVSIDVSSVKSLATQWTKRLLKQPYIHVKIANKDVYLDNYLDVKLQNDTYVNPFDLANNIIELEKTSVYVPSLSKTIKFTPKLWFYLETNDSKVVKEYVTLSLTFDDVVDFDVELVENVTFNEVKLYNVDGEKEESSDSFEFKFNGEELMLIPIPKGITGQKLIKNLNNSSDVLVLSDAMTMGMVINDIPPLVLGAALRTYANNSLLQPYGDFLSVRYRKPEAYKPEYNPVSACILNGKLTTTNNGVDKTEYDFQTPVLFNSLDYIPIVIAASPSYNSFDYCIGGASFLNAFYRLLSGGDVVNENTMENDPAMYSPNIWKWVYLIDGNNKIEMDGAMIDFNRFINNDWTVKLNVNMTSKTNYKLDIDQIKNKQYPFTKSFVELIGTDSISHPYSTEGYNNFLATDAVTQETSKNAMEIKNKWARTNFKYQAIETVLGSVGGGITAGAESAGAAVGAVGGAVGGIIKTALAKKGLENKIKMAQEEWANDWNQRLGNRYSEPSKMNPSGFESGSLLFSDVGKAKSDEYALFRTFKPTDIELRELWDDISVNGYPVMSEFNYKDYENRLKFNIVNCNPANKKFYFDAYIKQNMRPYTTLFAQDSMVDWFDSKCLSGMRLFRVDFNNKDISELIKDNVEINTLVPFVPRSTYAVYDNPKQLPIIVKTTMTKDNMPAYEINENLWVKQSKQVNSFTVKYSDIDGNCSTLDDFKRIYQYVGYNPIGTGIVVTTEKGGTPVKLVENFVTNTFKLLEDEDISEWTAGTRTGTKTILFDEVVKDKYDKEVYSALQFIVGIDSDGNKINPTDHQVGWMVDITPQESTIEFTFTEIDAYVFDDVVTSVSTTFEIEGDFDRLGSTSYKSTYSSKWEQDNVTIVNYETIDAKTSNISRSFDSNTYDAIDEFYINKFKEEELRDDKLETLTLDMDTKLSLGIYNKDGSHIGAYSPTYAQGSAEPDLSISGTAVITWNSKLNKPVISKNNIKLTPNSSGDYIYYFSGVYDPSTYQQIASTYQLRQKMTFKLVKNGEFWEIRMTLPLWSKCSQSCSSGSLDKHKHAVSVADISIRPLSSYSNKATLEFRYTVGSGKTFKQVINTELNSLYFTKNVESIIEE